MARTQGNKDFWLAALRAEGPALRAVVAEADPAAPVPSCPGWTIADLTSHMSREYAWVAGHVGRGTASRPDLSYADTPVPASPLDAFDEQFAALLSIFDSLDPEMPAWNWAPQAKRAAFWYRRMAHETAVHRWDAQMSFGMAEPLEAKLAADGVAEVLDTWLPAGRRRGPAAARGMVGLCATDLELEWFIRLRDGGGVALLDTDTLLDDDDHHERAAARGTASDLQLALWGRIGFDVLECAGDDQLLRALRPE
jgi:uncharacterized protein (TIGR03083 family)